MRAGLEDSADVASQLSAQIGQWLQHPAQFVEAAKTGVEYAQELARITFMAADSQSSFKGPLGRHKQVAWAEPIPINEVKAVAHALGCTVNDVVLAALSGALRRYLSARTDLPADFVLRALVPVNMRPPEQALAELGNRFGLVFLALPLAIEHPIGRLLAVREQMHALKHSREPVVSLAILMAMGIAPRIVQELVLRILAANASAVMTNVPGPPQAMYFSGAQITQQIYWVPQSGGIGLGVSIFSYNGRVQFGLISDQLRVPQPQAIVSLFRLEFEKLVMLCLMPDLM
jgi:diacylglycerol O-acyltransferase / wax synthase